MTETPLTGAAAPPPPPGPAPRPPLRRSREGRVLGGVAAGIARWLDIDPVIVRVVLVVLAVFGGSGLVIYILGWLFIPDEGAVSSEADRLIDQARQPGSSTRTVLIVVGAVVGALILANVLGGLWWAGGWGFGGGGAALLILAVVGVVIYLAQRPTPGAGPMAPPPGFGAPVSTAPEPGFAYGGAGAYPGYITTPTPPMPPRPRSYLGLVSLSLAVAVMGVLAAVAVTGVADVPVVVVLASGLGVLGLGLLAGAFAGRARWLVAIAIPLLLITAAASVVPRDIADRLSGGAGDRAWTPVTVADVQQPFRLGVGQATLDLTDLDLGGGQLLPAEVAVTGSVGVGDLRVIVPDDVTVRVDARASVGRVVVEGVAERDGDDVSVTGVLPGDDPAAATTLVLTVSVSIGNLEVSRA